MVFQIECKHENLNYWLTISEQSKRLVMVNDSLNMKRTKDHHLPHLYKIPSRKKKISPLCLEYNETILSLDFIAISLNI